MLQPDSIYPTAPIIKPIREYSSISAAALFLDRGPGALIHNRPRPVAGYRLRTTSDLPSTCASTAIHLIRPPRQTYHLRLDKETLSIAG